MDPSEYTDTGLGWFARTEWLKQSTGNFAYLMDFDDTNFPGQPALVGSTPLDFEAGGFPYGDVGYNLDACVMSGTDGPIFVFYIYGSTVIFCSPAPDARFYLASRDRTTSAVGSVSEYACNMRSGTWYYYSITMSGFTPYVPNYASIEAGIAALQADLISYNFSKTNSGYAVACIARWYTQNGTELLSPILISTNTDYTDMTTTATGHYLAKLNVQLDGVQFYMAFWDIPASELVSGANVHTADLTGYGNITLDRVFSLISSGLFASINIYSSPDPYEEEGGVTGEEGGDGEELEDDPVEEETLPLPSVAGHGFCTIYVPSSQELNQMASYLWGGSFDVSQVIKLFSNPMDSILGLSAVPVDLVGSPEQIYLGGVALTGVTMPKYTGRTSVKVNFGTVTVAERWGSYLDYAPYTDFSIYLPFIGIKPIKADDIMGKTVNLTYAIDILSGGCVAYLRPAGGSVLYEWSGQCAVQIPVTGRSYDNVFQSAMSVATATLAAVTAPASAPVLSGAVASAAVQAAASKPHIERSGAVNGITGFLGQLRPYLIRTIPEAFIPSEQNKFIGYPAYINVDLASVKGYNEVDSIHLENVTATGSELDEIETILKGGVIF